MDRENYYLLLGLEASVSDPHIIEAKINELERKWKDLVTKLNKPEHKRLLELVPDIRKCMLNPETRRAEAKAAFIMAAIDPAKYESARKAVSDGYAKIEEALKHNNLTDIYDFLSRNPANGNRIGRYATSDSVESLIERAKELMEAYRNLAGASDKMRLASLVVAFFQNDKKEAYDVYITLNVKRDLCHSIDTLVKYNDNKMNSESLAKLTSEFTRLYLPQKEVSTFIADYCAYKGYVIESAAKQSKTATTERKEKPQEPPKAPTQPKAPETDKKFTDIQLYVMKLKQNISGLKSVIDKQHALIALQRSQANSAQGNQRMQSLGRIKGMIIHQFAFKEYIDLCCVMAKGNALSDKEVEFLGLYKSFLRGCTADLEEKIFIREHILGRYKESVEQLQVVNAEEILQRMDVTNIE